MTDLHDLNTILQLAAALNIVCIAAFELGQFGNILEKNVLDTENKIHRRKEKIHSLIVTGLNSLEGLKDYPKLKQEISRIENGYNSIDSTELNEALKNLTNDIRNECTPLHIAGLCTFCTLWSIVALFLILFSELLPILAFHIFTCLGILYILLFILVKMYLDGLLFKKIKNAEADRKVRFEKRKRRFSKVLGVKSAAIILLAIMFVSVFICLIVEKSCFWLKPAEYLSPFLPFSSFVIYSFVTYFYSKRRQKYIDNCFVPIESEIEKHQESKKEINTYIKWEKQLN
ncbi:MAG: hypothetical protein LBT50_04415 [Prevotellaceae bacterium]|nr:hypothetical protein [Prevotellaceae bacterium]